MRRASVSRAVAARCGSRLPELDGERKNGGVGCTLAHFRRLPHPASASRGSRVLRVVLATGVRLYPSCRVGFTRSLHRAREARRADSRLLGKGHLQRHVSPQKVV